MADLTTQERLAALQARRRASGGSAAPQPQQPQFEPPANGADATAPLTLPAQARRQGSILGSSTADGAPMIDTTGGWEGSISTNSLVDTRSSRPVLSRIDALPSLDSIQIPWSWNRAAATAASVVSFAAMVVAMGPLLEQSETSAATATDDGSTEATDGPASLPEAPAVDVNAAVQTDPHAVLNPGASELAVQVPGADGTVGGVNPLLDPSAAVPADGTAADGAATTVAPASAAPDAGATPATPATPAPTPQAQPPATQAPTQQTQPPATQAPVTQAPTTQPPATQAPSTQPPATQAPTTQPPATQPPPPPTTAGSGG